MDIHFLITLNDLLVGVNQKVTIFTRVFTI
jgi:hypothetical protein